MSDTGSTAGEAPPAPPIPLDEPAGVERILVITAHPDDVDFGAAGSAAVWVKAGIEVTYCIVTDGDAGGSDRSISRHDMAVLRREEQRAAAAEVGVDNVVFLGYPDGRLTVSLELRRDISRQIRIVRPQRVLCPSPERFWERIAASHPDHLAAGEAALCAVYPDARNPFAHPELLDDEGLEPHTVPEIWIMASPRADRAVDITDVFDRKVAALRRHVSQIGEGDWVEARMREWAQANASTAGLPDGRLAELFQVVLTP
jgi:LmbE family N-acetylglucosaminyl deacetylase